jgi:hypothetical protein
VSECHCVEGWVCEAHADRGWPHDDCSGPGEQCRNPDCPWWAGPAPAALNTDDWTDVVSVTGQTKRSRRH